MRFFFAVASRKYPGRNKRACIMQTTEHNISRDVTKRITPITAAERRAGGVLG